MTADEFIKMAITKATGKVNDQLTSSDTKYKKMLSIGNYYIQAWASEPSVDWNSLYNPLYQIGRVNASDTFDLDDTISKISLTPQDYVRILKTDGTYLDYETVPADELQRYNRPGYVAKIGSTIKFSKPFTATDQAFNGTIYVPAYIKPDPILNPSDEIPVDDPLWLVTIAAAEYVRNDVVRQNQYGNLISEANNLMQNMKDNNGAQINQPAFLWGAAGADW